MKKDNLGDRMKFYESAQEPTLLPMLPTLARLDGKSFHTFTRGLKRPYDERMSTAMINTTIGLVNATGARIGYTQSDEISLAWYEDNPDSQIWFDYRHSKMVSSLAALCSVLFYREVLKLFTDYADKIPTFDARVWQVPTLAEGANTFYWRELDA